MNKHLHKSFQITLLLMLACVRLAFSQDSLRVTGSGYEIPSESVFGSQGQIITIYLVRPDIGEQKTVIANKFPLPVILDDVQVKLLPSERQLPLLSVQYLRSLIAISLQLPFDVVPLPNLSRQNYLMVLKGNRLSEVVDLQFTLNSAHIVRVCDSFFVNRPAKCDQAIITHLNGKLVTMDDPAKEGEVVTLYAVGLGATLPAITDGEQAKGIHTLRFPLRLYFDFNPNAYVTDVRTASV